MDKGEIKSIAVVLAVVLAIVYGSNMYRMRNLNKELTNEEIKVSKLEEEVSYFIDKAHKLEVKNEALEENYWELEKNYGELQRDYNKIIEEYEFYKQYAVCLNENDPYYHTYTCKHFDESLFWIYNIDKAKEQGYDPCPDCRLNEQ